MKLAVADRELSTITAILRQHLPAADILAFGSRLLGTYQPYSDLDLAIRAAEPIPLAELSKLTEAFSNSDLPFKVDVIDLCRVSEEFRAVVEKQHIVIQLAGSASKLRHKLEAMATRSPGHGRVDCSRDSIYGDER